MLANTQCPPLPRDSADRGGAAGGGVRKEATSPLCQVRRKAALRLTVNPFGSIEPLHLYRHWHGDTEEDIVVFQIFSYGAQLRQP